MAQQPQWSPPPQQPTGWGAPGYGGAPPRPTGVTLASIYLIVMGVLLVLGGAACGLAGGALFGVGSGVDTSGVFGALAGIAVVAGLIAAVLGILQIAAGAGAMGGKGWGRWIGIILSVIFAILFILGGLSALGRYRLIRRRQPCHRCPLRALRVGVHPGQRLLLLPPLTIRHLPGRPRTPAGWSGRRRSSIGGNR